MDPETVPPVPAKLSSVGDLLSRSWKSLTQNWTRLLIIDLYMIGAVIAFFILMGVVALLSLGSAVGDLSKLANFDWQSFLYTLTPAQFILPLIIMSFLLIVLSVVITVFSFAQISLLADTEKHPLKYYLDRSKSFIIPLFILGFTSSLLIFGNLFFLFIPGIIASVLLGFVVYEVILNQKRGMAALRGSATIVSQNFGHLFTRILVLIIIQSLIQGIVPYSLEQAGDALSVVLSLFNLIISPLTTWFSTIYMIKLYQEVKDNTNWDHQLSLTWMIVLAVLGWAAAIALIIFASSSLPALSELPKNLPPQMIQ